MERVFFLFHELFFSNEYDSSEDEDELIQIFVNRCKKRILYQGTRKNNITNFVEETLLRSTTVEFQSHFRLTVEAFNWLLERIGHNICNSSVGRKTIHPKVQLLAVLWLLATPESYRSIGNRFDMSKSTLFESFVRVTKAINQIATEVITWPRGQSARTVENGFFKLAKIPGIIGAIDGCYIPIKAPSVDPEVYINRKMFYGITLQAVCDYKRRFTDIFTGFPSSVSDKRVFRNSDFYNKVVNNTQDYFSDNQFIIGDKAYPLLSWCIPPYIDRGNLLPVHNNFNNLHAKSRQVIERSFALLLGRFRRLKYVDMNRTDLIPSMILSACIMHNICLDFDDQERMQYEEEGRQHLIQREQAVLPPNQENRGGDVAVQFRNNLARNLYQ